MSSNFPFASNNTFGIDSFNQFTLNAWNPYSLYHYTVMIVSPNFPDGQSEDIVMPEITVDDFMFWAKSFLDIDDENHTLNPLCEALITIAKQYIDINIIGDKDGAIQYKRIVSMYVGHYLELHLQILKDEKDSLGFNPENKEYKIELEVPHGSIGDFKRTNFGQMFWSLYGPLARFAFQGNYSTWGAI